MFQTSLQRFAKPKPSALYKYHFIESDYQSDSLSRDGGRKLKRFYNEFCQHMFDYNLTLCENEWIRELPIVYNERANSAGISIAFSRLTPFVMSEYGIDCKNAKWGENECKNFRFVDFWCSPADQSFELWIEAKHLWLNVGKKAKREFDAYAKGLIREALNQLGDIDTLHKSGEIEENHHFKLALFSVNVYYACQSNANDLDSVPEEVSHQLFEFCQEEIQNISQHKGKKLGVLVGALDLRPSIGACEGNPYQIYGDYYMPFSLLCGVVMANA